MSLSLSLSLSRFLNFCWKMTSMAFSSLATRPGALLYGGGFRSRYPKAAPLSKVVRRDVSEPMQISYQRLNAPVLNDSIIPVELLTSPGQGFEQKSDTRIRIFSGTSNPSLAETQGRESIAAKLVANLITEAGANCILACDLHSGQSLGYFDIAVDHVFGQPVILDYLARKKISTKDLVVVSPDVGGVARAYGFVKKLNDAPLAIVDKRRQEHNVAEAMNLIGDVKGKVTVLVDDMIDTAGTITNAAALLQEEGANAVPACCTHAGFRRSFPRSNNNKHSSGGRA